MNPILGLGTLRSPAGTPLRQRQDADSGTGARAAGRAFVDSNGFLSPAGGQASRSWTTKMPGSICLRASSGRCLWWVKQITCVFLESTYSACRAAAARSLSSLTRMSSTMNGVESSIAHLWAASRRMKGGHVPTFIPTLMWCSYFLFVLRHLASLPLPSISSLPCFRQRFMTRRMVSRLTLGQSRSTSAIPKVLIML
jgi:hypothetical protein